MTKLEQSLVQAIITLFYEPEIHEGGDTYGDYDGLTVERRMVLKIPNLENPFDPIGDNGYELFITTICDRKYIGLYRTWTDDEYGGHEGRVEALINTDIGTHKYATHRLTEVNRLIEQFSMLLSSIKKH